MKLSGPAVLVACAVTAWPAEAQDEFPDIVGTWTGPAVSVRMEQPAGKAEFIAEDVTQIITEQRGRRFVGTMHSGAGPEQFSVQFVGVFVDEKRFRWSEAEGFVEGTVLGPNEITSCYVRTASDSHEAACQTLYRTK